MSQKTISQDELQNKLDIARQVPDIAHLPSFGLVLSSWDFQDAELIAQAENILKVEGVQYLAVTEVCQALFWYRNAQNELHLHFWR